MDSDGRLTGEELRTLLEHEKNLPPDEAQFNEDYGDPELEERARPEGD